MGQYDMFEEKIEYHFLHQANEAYHFLEVIVEKIYIYYIFVPPKRVDTLYTKRIETSQHWRRTYEEIYI